MSYVNQISGYVNPYTSGMFQNSRSGAARVRYMHTNNDTIRQYAGIGSSRIRRSIAAAGSSSTGQLNSTNQTFYSRLQSQQAHQMKQEIYNRFQVDVDKHNTSFNCSIPTTLLAHMSTNQTLKDKVFRSLETYTSDAFKQSVMGADKDIKACTLIFDEDGDMTAALQTNAAKQGVLDHNTNLLYQRLLQQSAWLPYRTGMYSNLYGLNGISNYNSLQNSLYSSMLGGLF